MSKAIAPTTVAAPVRDALRRKDFASAAVLLREHLAASPGDWVAWRDLALVLATAGQPGEAIQAFQSCIAAGGEKAAIAFDYGRVLSDAGDNAAAEKLLREVIGEKPRRFDLTNLLGVVLKRSGKLQDAIRQFEFARKLDPKNVSPFINLGNTWMMLGDLRKAEDAFSRAVRLAPKQPEHWRLLGVAQQRQQAIDRARSSFARGHLLNPRDPRICIDYVQSLIDCGELEKAQDIAFRAREFNPGDPKLNVAHARVLRRLGRRDEAQALLEDVLAAHPQDEHALLALARMIEKQDREAANGYFRRAVAARPESIELASALCDSLNRSRYGNEADHVQEAYEIGAQLVDRHGKRARSEARDLRSLFARCVDFERLDRAGTLQELADSWIARGTLSAFHMELARVQSVQDRVQMLSWHRGLGDRLQSRIKPLPQAPAIVGRAKVRVGFLSSDLRHHPVAYFALPLLEQFDRDRFEVFCYSFYERQRDAVQAHIESQVDGFRWWPRRPDGEVAAGIAADQLNILFELGGSTDMNKLDVMAFRPSPLGASWLGYPHSAGLSTIDYILVDPFIKPDDPRLLIEKPFEMPETWVALSRLGFTEQPIEEGLPESRHGCVTFGTMNNPYKYTPECFDAWARILSAVPGSRFLFVRPEGGVAAFRSNVEKEFAKRGVEADRVRYVPIRGKHLPHYNDIDIALDTFPHVGGTTTCETLWMGVPVVTLVGPAFFERLSYSNLNNAGLGDLCAFSVDEYVDKALALAEDRTRRRVLRQSLRRQIKEHPLGQPERFTRAFYDTVARVVNG